MRLHDFFEAKVRLDPKCWTGYKIGNPKTKMKGGVRVNNCVPAESVGEGREFGSYYYEQLAQQLFDQDPGLDASGRAESVLNAAYPMVKDQLGDKQARMLFNYDEDFPGDLVTAYAHLQKQDATNESDMSGIMHAAKNYNKSFIITADVAEGGRKKYRVRAQSERVAREKFAKHYSMAKIVDIKEEE